ncbi:tyrosine-protein phosphatase [Yoonia sp. F2084L]|uniref:phosphatase domain-containing putative toxin n=1 Tax=Yoonia sp. F2084L TaxID=2926419 RepID=UPI001FF1DFF8|nr:tyrosine-protein phosphatase [Yoonia sp. F2084L]MCK0096445.1 tyrosine-protein phosphatase [Yoonia sp. F2084L]
MIRKIFRALDQKERDLRKSFGHDITDPAERRRSMSHMRWLDHGIFRTFWHNFDKVADGVYRSNQPDPKRFEAYAKMGIKAVLNLRGVEKQPHYLFEEESCAALGMTLVTIKMTARRAPKVQALLDLMDAFETIERPFLMHCKSGADRTGLAAILYLMVHEGKTLDQARAHLSFRYLHIRRTATGILDHFCDVYAARNAQSPIAILDWIKTEYDREAVTQSFLAKQAALKPWQGWR